MQETGCQGRAPRGWGMAACIAGAVALAGCSQAPGKAPLTPAQTCLQSLDPAVVEICREALAAAPDDIALRNRIALLRLKSGSLAAARQAYQIARSKNPNDAEAQFGYGLALQIIGQAGGNIDKQAAARRDSTVVDKFRKYGFPEPDLMTYDTEPKVVAGPSLGRVAAMTPKLPLDRDLGLDVKCLVATSGKLHDCAVLTSVAADKQPFADAAKAIAALSKVKPALDKGAPVADAPVVLTMVFTKTG